MNLPRLEACPGCSAVLPVQGGGPTHRYMTSSAACWGAFGLLNDPEQPLEPAPFNALTVDTFAVQHPGTPSNQSVNSVAIHLMVLYGVLERNFLPEQALWLRMRPGRFSNIAKHDRFHLLTPPNFIGRLTVSDVIAEKTSLERSRLVEAWVKEVWSVWAVLHCAQVEAWFEKFVVSERF